MKKIKYLVVAAFCLMLTSQAYAGDKGYIQASVSLADIGDATAAYRGVGSSTYGLDEDLALGASVGWHLHKNIALEVKLNYIEGDVTDISGSKARDGSQYNYAAATVGLNYNIDRFTFDKSVEFAVIPYVGAGIGYDVGYLDAQKDSEVNCQAPGDCASGDNRNDHGSAMRASIGGLIELHKNIGVDINYDYVWGTVDTHMASAGIRVMF